MKLSTLESKTAAVGKLLGKTLRISGWGRKYRVEEANTDSGFFTIAWLPAQDLWNRLDMAQTALEMLQCQHEAETERLHDEYARTNIPA
jgi:hypothetical protein